MHAMPTRACQPTTVLCAAGLHAQCAGPAEPGPWQVPGARLRLRARAGAAPDQGPTRAARHGVSEHCARSLLVTKDLSKIVLVDGFHETMQPGHLDADTGLLCFLMARDSESSTELSEQQQALLTGRFQD